MTAPNKLKYNQTIIHTMCIEAEFLAFLDEYGLPHEIFEIQILGGSRGPYLYIKGPYGVELHTKYGGLVFYRLYGVRIGSIKVYTVNCKPYFESLAEEYKIRREHASLLKEVSALREEIVELRLLPGAPGYYAAKEHYENLAKK